MPTQFKKKNSKPLPNSISLPHPLPQPLYFTSLRVVCRTFVDCKSVRSILRGFRVPFDEQDLSMDAKYVEELQGIFGPKRLALLVVFIGGKCIGGAERVGELHKSGDIKELIDVLLFWDGGCDECGGLRFVLFSVRNAMGATRSILTSSGSGAAGLTMSTPPKIHIPPASSGSI